MANKSLGHGEKAFSAPGKAPCVVAFHGFGGTATELRPLLDRIAGAGYAVDAPLLPGHGTAPADLQKTRFDDWVDAARAKTRAAAGRYGPCVLLGFSLGSLVALELASEADEGLGRLAGLVVLGNAVRLNPITSLGLGVFASLGRHMPDVYVRKPRLGDVRDPKALAELVAYDRHPLRAATEVLRAGPRVRKEVGRVTCPTLILHGRYDHVCPWQNALWLADHLGSKDVSVRIFERSAHVLACDFEREQVAEEVCRFLDRLALAQARPVDP